MQITLKIDSLGVLVVRITILFWRICLLFWAEYSSFSRIHDCWSCSFEKEYSFKKNYHSLHIYLENVVFWEGIFFYGELSLFAHNSWKCCLLKTLVWASFCSVNGLFITNRHHKTKYSLPEKQILLNRIQLLFKNTWLLQFSS